MLVKVGSSVDGFAMREVRFVNVKLADLKTWQLQTRQRKTETVEFHNVSLHRGKVTDVEMKMADQPLSKPAILSTEKQFSQILPPGFIVPPGTLLEKKAAALAARKDRIHIAPFAGRQYAERPDLARQQEILDQRAKQHGYKLGPGQLLKHIGEQFPKRNKFTDRPCVNFFRSTPEWTLLTGSQYDEGTLAIALEWILHLKAHQIECDPALLDAPFPGDWMVSWDIQKFRSPTNEEVAAFEEAVNAERTSKLSFEWKQVEEVSLVVKGNYKFSPVAGPDGKLEIVKGDVAKQADGTFQFPIRRNSTTGAVGSYPKLLQAIGEVTGMAIVDEADKRPARRDFFWRYAEKLIPGYAPLDPADEKIFLDSLSKQTGFQFVKEKRLVHKLFIKARPAIASGKESG